MTHVRIDEMTVKELVEYFTRIALDQYEAILDEDNDKFNILYDDMTAVKNVFKKRGTNHRRGLILLFNHPNRQVRFNAAIATLAIVPDDARQVLQTIIDRNEYPQAADARGILRSLDAGKYITR